MSLQPIPLLAPVNILTYGTFDLLHHGHLHLLERAKALGSHLTVGVSTDRFNALKGKACHQPYAERARVVTSVPFVDLVIPETGWEQKRRDVEAYRIDRLVMGDDWEGAFDFLAPLCEVIYLPRTPGICSTRIREAMALGDAR
jgi:glycerol-3-phosphate cytidylyltransferase